MTEKTPAMIHEIQKIREYLDYVEEHYNNVQKAWRIVQEKCNGKDFPFLYDDHLFWALDAEIKNHDLSKLSNEEFIPYRKNFFPANHENKVYAQKDFELAWEHHKRKNLHHWQTWTQSEENKNIFNLVHNICDWIAMGFKFEDTARSYYNKNKAEIILPEWAEKLMNEIFDCVYGPQE